MVWVCFLGLGSLALQGQVPDLTDTEAVSDVKASNDTFFPRYVDHFNLGPTGLRGWISMLDLSDEDPRAKMGVQTRDARQILVTHVGAGTPAAGLFRVDDVILGVGWGAGGTVQDFTDDARKSFGIAIGEAEKAENGGVLRVKRWRGGNVTTVSMTLPVLGAYTATAPYNCPKSSAILRGALRRLEREDPFANWSGAITGLAMLATGEGRFNEKLENLAMEIVDKSTWVEPDLSFSTWDAGYELLFLAEYYFAKRDAEVLPGIRRYALTVSQAQGRYGTFGHGSAMRQKDGSFNGSVPWYGPISSAALVANIGLVLAKKAIEVSGGEVRQEVTAAIQRASNFYQSYVHRGCIPYGEHAPYRGRDQNGRQAMAAVMYGMMGGETEALEFFSRWSLSTHVTEDRGHTGHGFSLLWTMLGANAGGEAAGSAFFNEVKWNRDLARRPDGSFSYDEVENEMAQGFSPSERADYWSDLQYYQMNATAMYVLQFALPKKNLMITGKEGFGGAVVTGAKISNGVWAGHYPKGVTALSTQELLGNLGEYDLVVREFAAKELGGRVREHEEIRGLLIAMTEDQGSSFQRAGACEALGYVGGPGTAQALVARLSDSDYWVRTMAAEALRRLGQEAGPHVVGMVQALVKNAPEIGVIDPRDPLQYANAALVETLFTQEPFRSDLQNLPDELFHGAVRVGLRLPAGAARSKLSDFIRNELSLEDVRSVAPALVDAVKERSPADQMSSNVIRLAGLATLAKYRVEEGIPLALLYQEQTWHDLLDAGAGPTDPGQSLSMEPLILLRERYGTAAKEVIPTLEKWIENRSVFEADTAGIGAPEVAAIIHYTNAALDVLKGSSQAPNLNQFKSVTISGASPLSSTRVRLTANATDLDGGVLKYIWRKVSGPGSVSFSTNNSVGSGTTEATFGAPGTYVFEVSVVDASILEEQVWRHSRQGYKEFETYNNDYGIVTSGQRSVEVGGVGYFDWSSRPETGLISGVNDAPGDDPDGDGLSNLMEFVMASSPVEAFSRKGVEIVEPRGGEISIEFDRNKEAVGVSLVLEHSENLIDWSEIVISQEGGEGITVIPGATTDRVKVVMPARGKKRFVRLKAGL